MNSSAYDFVIINGIIVALIVIYLLWRPRNKAIRFRLGSFTKPPLEEDSTPLFPRREPPPHAAGWGEDTFKGRAPGVAEDSIREVKQLNVIFSYNGHNFDAYEILGLPAGCSWDDVEAAYRKSKKSMGKDGAELIQCAYETIKQHRSDR